MLKDMDFYHLREIFLTNVENNYWIQNQMLQKLLPKKVAHKVAEATGKFVGNKIGDAAAKSNDDKVVKQKPVIVENPRNIKENELRQAL